VTALHRKLRAALRRVADPDRAAGAQAYMKSSMPFLGVGAPALRQVCREVFADVRFATADDWQRQVLSIWRDASFREERHAAIELTGLRAARDFQAPDALPMYEELIVTGAWWDYVDGIAKHRLGPLVRAYPRPMKRAMRAWSRCEDMWKRRASILCQLGAKQDTDLDLLYACIEPSIASREFFLRKAIGWALRDLAWTNPDEVVRYVRANEARLSGLSMREALKNVGK
jgi:3-methyladenine DNA glycosylase AlkD